jgi:hypothetical protein
MSNLSNIGFSVRTDDEFYELINKIAALGQPLKSAKGSYICYSDGSGAEIYIQILDNEFIGINPHYKGKSQNLVGLVKTIPRNESELDGAFYAWAGLSDTNNVESGAYPFVFDLPDFYTYESLELPKSIEIQLTAFASEEFEVFENEEAYFNSQSGEFKFASRSFIPSGLFSVNSENEMEGTTPAQAYAIFTGFIKEFALKVNQFTKEQFYWILVDTLGGEIDVVVDTKLVPNGLKINSVVKGQFWLSGKLLNATRLDSKSFWKKIMNFN